jgi:hypothetical protein
MMHDRNITAHGQCERSRRTAGFPAQLKCRICDRGPCRFGIGERVIEESATITPEMWAEIPNRLHGAVINTRGEAI